MISPSGQDRPGLRELLAFYAEAGVDEALTDEPVDRFAADEVRARNSPPDRENSQKVTEGTGADMRRAETTPPGSFATALPSTPSKTQVAVPDEAQMTMSTPG